MNSDDAVFLEVHNRLDAEANMAAYRKNVEHIDTHWMPTRTRELASIAPPDGSR
jgi:hypothetical protein